MTVRGIGVAGALDHEIVAALAQQAEALGYATFWTNDTPGGDGLAAVAAAAGATSVIRLGVGVIPIDRRPAAAINERIRALGLPENRLVIGIGAGDLRAGAVLAVEEAATQLAEGTDARVVVGALGPRMCAAAGRAADGALLNWLTPEYAQRTGDIVRDAAESAGKSKARVGVYVRVGLAGRGQEKVFEEGRRYAGFPQYAAHFARMGVDPIATTAVGDPEQIRAALAAYDGAADEVVVRAVAAEETLAAYAEVLAAARPVGHAP